MIKNVVFDFGNVLIDWNPQYLFCKIASEEEVEWFMQNVWSGEWNETLDAGVSLADNMKRLLAKYPEYDKYVTAFHTRWFETLGEVNKETVAMLADVQKAGYATYGLTNWSAETFLMTRKAHPFFDTFKGIVVSGEEKVCKPDAKIYTTLLERYQLVPEQSVFIDDRQENLDAARKLGIDTILFGTAGQVREALKSKGISGL